MAVNDEVEVSGVSFVKKLLEDYLRESHVPSYVEVSWLAYVMCSGRGGSYGRSREEKVTPQSDNTTHTQLVMSELLKEAFTNCYAQVKAGGGGGGEHHSAEAMPTLWNCLLHLHGNNKALPTHCILPLCTLSCNAAFIVHITMEIAEVLRCDHAPILNSFGELWSVYMKGLVEQCLKLWGSCERRGLLVRLGLSLLVTSILDTIEQQDGGNVTPEDEGVTNENRGVAPQGKSTGKVPGSQCTVRTSSDSHKDCALDVWRCVGVMGSVVSSVEQNFSTYFYEGYCQCETRDVVDAGGDKGSTVKSQVQDSGGTRMSHVLESVQYLKDCVLVMVAVSKGLGSERLQRLVAEFALRLTTQNLNHMHKLSEGVVGADVSVYVLYRILASLHVLHHMLLDMCAPQDMESVLSAVCVRVEEELQSVGVAVQEYHRNLCLTSVLLDSSSSHWTSHSPFYEGQRCSWTVQMWSYHMRGLCHDLCTYLPASLACVREGILCEVLGVSLSHLVSRYSIISPTSTHLSHYLADIVFILTCVNSLLPWLGGVVSDTPLPVLSLHHSCELLMTMAVLQSVSLSQLLDSLSHMPPSQERSPSEMWAWQRWVEDHLQVLTPTTEISHTTPTIAMPPLALRRLLAPYSHFDSLNLAGLLQALLEEGGALCVALCKCASSSDRGGCEGVRWSEVAHAVLHLLSVLPHVSWGLTTLVSAMSYKTPRLHGDPLQATEHSDPVMVTMQNALGPPLMSYLVKIAAETVSCSNRQTDEWAWLQDVLVGMCDCLHREVCRPVLCLLHWLASAQDSGGCGREDQLVGDTVAKILVGILCHHIATLEPHPFQCSSSVCITHLSHIFQLMGVALDPSSPPPQIQMFCSSDDSPLLPVATVQRVLNIHAHNWKMGRLKLGRLVDVSHTHQPELLLRKELQSCTLEEHEIAAQLIASNEQGLSSLQNVCRQLREFYCVQQTTTFNPLLEYKSISTLGCGVVFSQERLTDVRKYLQDQDILRSCLSWLAKHESPSSVEALIRKWRWELHENNLEDLELGEQQLVLQLISALKSLNIDLPSLR